MAPSAITQIVNSTGISENTVIKVIEAFIDLSVTDQSHAVKAIRTSQRELKAAVDKGAEGLKGEDTIEDSADADTSDTKTTTDKNSKTAKKA